MTGREIEAPYERHAGSALSGVIVKPSPDEGKMLCAVDALAPAAAAARSALNSGASIERVAEAASKAAASGAEASKGLIATVGKSKGLGDRTVGFIDPGALTTSILLDSIFETIRRHSEMLPEDE